MIVKKKSLSLKRIGLEALIRRLPDHHPRKREFENELGRVRGGEYGEKLLEQIFQKYELPFEHYIFYDLHLRSTGLFQIDALLISERGAFILEVKNISGRIEFPARHRQVIRTLDSGQVDSYECPSVQLDRNSMLLEDWFHARHFTIPIHKAVVFTRSQIITGERENLTILFPNEVPVYLRKIHHSPKVIPSGQLRKIVDSLLASHSNYSPFPLSHHYQVPKQDILKGVHCQCCGLFTMIPYQHGWRCKRCGQSDRNAHTAAILDYVMLIDTSITNQRCREFLHLTCPQKTKRLLQKSGLSAAGERRARIYHAELDSIERLWNTAMK
ncbi:hypothetical protein HNO89_001823 [Sporosarcina luteola]|nr:hypothetical protein [Sporosarcina luteola]